MARRRRNQLELQHRSVHDAQQLQLLRGRQGYLDACAGTGYPYEYDDWSEDEQLAYESTRLWHANLVQAAIRPPAWRMHHVPAPLLEANQHAHEQVGTPIPIGQMRANSKPVLLEPMPLPRRWRRR